MVSYEPCPHMECGLSRRAVIQAIVAPRCSGSSQAVTPLVGQRSLPASAMSSPFEGYSRRHSDLSDPLVHYDRYSSGEHPPRGDVGYGGTYGAAGGAPSEDHNSTEGWHRIEPVARDDSHGGGGPYAPLYDDGRKTKVSCWSLAPNFIGSVANMSNAAIGAGVLAFPYAFSLTGVMLGPALAVFFAAIMWWTLHILTKAADSTGSKSYQDAVLQVLGVKAERAIEVSMWLYLFGCCVAFLNVIGDQVTPLAQLWFGHGAWIANRDILLALFTCVVILPLCLLKRIEYLSFTSFLAVLSILYMEAVLIRRAYLAGPAVYERAIWGKGIFQAIPLICFALQCHLVLIPQYSAVKFRTVGKMDWINTCTMVICLVIYIPAGLAGYMQLGTATPGDVLVAFGNALDISIGRICIACTCIFSYPLLQFVARTVIEDLLFRGATPSNVRMGVETVFFIGASLAVSIAVPKVETVLGFTGSTTAVVQIFIFPGIMWAVMHRQHVVYGKIFGACVALFGLLVGIVSTVVLATNT